MENCLLASIAIDVYQDADDNEVWQLIGDVSTIVRKHIGGRYSMETEVDDVSPGNYEFKTIFVKTAVYRTRDQIRKMCSDLASLLKELVEIDLLETIHYNTDCVAITFTQAPDA